MAQVLLVGIGGFLGAVTRYLLGQSPLVPHSSEVPYSTLVINLLGSFVLGMTLNLIHSKSHPFLFYILVPGFLGGFTTYSAFSGETFALIERQMYVSALIYVALTVLGGVLFCGVGFYTSKAISVG